MNVFIKCVRGESYDKFDICLWYVPYYQKRGNKSSIFSGNSEANASELLENIEETFLRVIIFSMFESSIWLVFLIMLYK